MPLRNARAGESPDAPTADYDSPVAGSNGRLNSGARLQSCDGSMKGDCRTPVYISGQAEASGGPVSAGGLGETEGPRLGPRVMFVIETQVTRARTIYGPRAARGVTTAQYPAAPVQGGAPRTRAICPHRRRRHRRASRWVEYTPVRRSAKSGGENSWKRLS